jgi:hypothetical protein
MSNLIKLKSCCLCRLSVHGDIAAFSHLKEITLLIIGNCSNIEGDVSSFSQLTKLNELMLIGCDKIKGLKSSLKGIRKNASSFVIDGTSVE